MSHQSAQQIRVRVDDLLVSHALLPVREGDQAKVSGGEDDDIGVVRRASLLEFCRVTTDVNLATVRMAAQGALQETGSATVLPCRFSQGEVDVPGVLISRLDPFDPMFRRDQICDEI